MLPFCFPLAGALKLNLDASKIKDDFIALGMASVMEMLLVINVLGNVAEFYCC